MPCPPESLKHFPPLNLTKWQHGFANHGKPKASRCPEFRVLGSVLEKDREYLTKSATIRRDNRGNRSVETSFYCKHRQCSQHHLITLVKVSCRIALSIFTSADSADGVEHSKLPFTISRRSTLPFCAAHTDLRSKSLRRELLLMRLVRGAYILLPRTAKFCDDPSLRAETSDCV